MIIFDICRPFGSGSPEGFRYHLTCKAPSLMLKLWLRLLCRFCEISCFPGGRLQSRDMQNCIDNWFNCTASAPILQSIENENRIAGRNKFQALRGMQGGKGSGFARVRSGLICGDPPRCAGRNFRRLSVQRSVHGLEGRLPHDLGQGRMGMDGCSQIMHGRPHLQGQGPLGDQVGGVGTGDMDAKEFAGP